MKQKAPLNNRCFLIDKTDMLAYNKTLFNKLETVIMSMKHHSQNNRFKSLQIDEDWS